MDWVPPGRLKSSFDAKRSRIQYSYSCSECKHGIKSYSDNAEYAMRPHMRHCKAVAFVKDADFVNADVVEGEDYDVSSSVSPLPNAARLRLNGG